MRYEKAIAKQVHRTRAATVVQKDPSCGWVAHRPEILDELGRIPCDYALLDLAKRLCTLRPTTDEAVELIRQHRQFDKLADAIVHTVNDYCKSKPETTRSDILRALDQAGGTLSKINVSGEPGRHQFLRQKIDSPSQVAAAALQRPGTA